MEADLNASLQLVVGGFLSTGFTTDTLAWIFFLFIEDDNDEDDQRHKTCLARERERETACCLNDWARPQSG